MELTGLKVALGESVRECDGLGNYFSFIPEAACSVC